MTRYYALVLVPGDADTPEEEACEAAAELLFPTCAQKMIPKPTTISIGSSSQTI
jgi:hypothetical protein